MKCSRYLAGIAAAGLTAATGAAAQSVTTPSPPKGEQATPLLLQAVGNQQSEVQQALEILRTHVEDLLAEPISEDIDLSLSQKMMAFNHIEIDMSQLVLAYASDPSLRRLAAVNIEVATQRISSARDWQVRQKMLRQQTTPAAKP
jgi:hypothetical protein